MPNLLTHFFRWKKKEEPLALPALFQTFRELLDYNNQALDLMADMGEKLGGDYLFDKHYVETTVAALEEVVYKIVYDLNLITKKRYWDLFDALEKAKKEIQGELESRFTIPKGDWVYPLGALTKEMSDYVGEKMATLGELRSRLGLDIPEGFVISTYAYKNFIDYNRLEKWVAPLAEGPLPLAELEEKAKELQKRIGAAKIPPEVNKAIRRACPSGKTSPPDGWAVRSSALGEDSRISYAGQYVTVLNVPSAQLTEAYKQVVASLFSPQVIAYRQKKQIEQKEMAMAVGCTFMVSPRVSGVTYSADPTQPEGEEMILSACWGLGKLVVDGEGETDQYRVGKTPPYPVLKRHIGKKTKQYVAISGQGVSLTSVPDEQQEQACLDEDSLRKLTDGALRLEQYMKSFQDIEWAIDREGRIIYLQTRPLQIPMPVRSDKSRLVTAAQRYPILLKDAGVIASRGIGAGTVVQVQSEEESQGFPRGAVLVLKHTSPRMSRMVPLASAVVTDIGAVTGHMATICREFRIPTIVDTQKATRTLLPGMEVTVDAEENVIYQGIVKELLTAQLLDQRPYEETYEFKLLRRLLKKLSILNLTDPHAPEFDPAHCRTFHDIIRFAHEMAVRKIAQGIQPSQVHIVHSLAKLKLPIPLNLTVVDIDGGIKKGVSGPEIDLEAISCEPLLILLKALIAPGVWQSQPVDLDLKGFMSSFTSNVSTQALATDRSNVNLAIVSREYVNLNLGLGYHFNLIDGNLSDDRDSNYLYFRFFGGVTEFTRRSRRVKVLAQILEKNDFAVECKGDLIIGRIKKIDRPNLENKFRLTGRLIGFTRQLDVLLRTDRDIDFFTNQFFEEELEGHLPSS
jgi:pyruvate, water dikinase